MQNKIVISLALSFLTACANSPGNGRNSPDSIQRSLNDLRSIQAESTAQQSEMQEQLRSLVGRIEDLEYRVKGRPVVDQASSGTYMPPAAPLPPNPNVRDDQPTVPVFRPATQPQLPPALAAYDTPPPIVPLSELVKDEEQVRHLDVQFSRTFTDVLYFVRRGEFRQALTLLSEVLSASEGKEGHAQALFWQGVCSDGVGANREALTAYNQVISKYPNTDRARLSLLRLASVFIRLGDIPTARISLQKLIAESPSSKEADQARLKLKDL